MRLDGDKLKAYGRENMVTQLLPALKAHKEALKAFLCTEEREFYEERAAIAEYDGELSHSEAEAQAFAEWEAWRSKRNYH